MQHHRAFSLVEVLVAIAIVAVLASLLLPAIGQVRSAVRSTVCRSQLRQIGVALLAYTQEHRGILPPGEVSPAAGIPDAWTAADPGRYAWGEHVYWCDGYVTDVIMQGGYHVYGGISWGPGTSGRQIGGLWTCPEYRQHVPFDPNLSYGLNDFFYARILAPGQWTERRRLQAVSRTSQVPLVGESAGDPALALGGSFRAMSPCRPGDVPSWGVAPWFWSWRVAHRGSTNLLFVDGRVGGSGDLTGDLASGSVVANPY